MFIDCHEHLVWRTSYVKSDPIIWFEKTPVWGFISATLWQVIVKLFCLGFSVPVRCLMIASFPVQIIKCLCLSLSAPIRRLMFVYFPVKMIKPSVCVSVWAAIFSPCWNSSSSFTNAVEASSGLGSITSTFSAFWIPAFWSEVLAAFSEKSTEATRALLSLRSLCFFAASCSCCSIVLFQRAFALSACSVLQVYFSIFLFPNV